MINNYKNTSKLMRAALQKVRSRFGYGSWWLAACILLILVNGANSQELSTPPMTPRISAQPATLDLIPEPYAFGLGSASGPINIPPVAIPNCPTIAEWDLQLGRTGEYIDGKVDGYLNAGYRPISVSATDSGDNARFDIIWIKDTFGENKLAVFRRGLVKPDFEEEYDIPGCRLIAIDAYGGTADDIRYIAAWACDGKDGRHLLDVSAEEIKQYDTALSTDGFSPIWIDVFFDGRDTHYSALWAKDGESRALELDLEPDTDEEPLWNAKTDNDWRMISLSQYFLPDPEQTDLEQLTDSRYVKRYAAVWQSDSDACGIVTWEAFRFQEEENVHIKAIAQGAEGPRKIVNNGTLEINGQDAPGRVTLDGAPINGDEEALHSIISSGSIPEHGAILVLQSRPGRKYVVSDNSIGNIRLRRWDADTNLNPLAVSNGCTQPGVSCSGQSVRLNDWQTRLTLQFHASSGDWHEVQRNGLSPDRYMPIAIDAFGSGTNRKLTSVWLGDQPERRFRAFSAVTPQMLNAASTADQNAYESLVAEDLNGFDKKFRDFMEERLISSAVLAVAKGGRLVISRGYSYADPEELEIARVEPDALFRIASLSKPITAVTIMKLVEQGVLNIDEPITQVPRLFDLIGSGWDGSVFQITPRQLLGHLGGWDRDISPDYTINQDFQVCSQIEPVGLPTDVARIISFARNNPDYPDLDHIPGRSFKYSNFGYTLLGRIIEAETELPYEQFVRNNILLPIGADLTFIHPVGPGGTLSKEVRYYSPGYPMFPSVFGIGIGDGHPLRQGCNKEHADLVPEPYGHQNLRPMDSHGGWISTAPDLIRFLSALDDSSFLDQDLRGEMWTLQRRREARVITFDAASGNIVDRSFDARFNAPVAPNISLPIDTADRLYIGMGLKPFNSIAFTLDSVGDPYDLQFEYFGPQGWTILSTNIDEFIDEEEDECNAFFQAIDATSKVTVSFEAPDDWRARVLNTVGDLTPRYWLRVSFRCSPDSIAALTEASLVFVASEVTYALGWQVDLGPSNTPSPTFSRFSLPVVGNTLMLSKGTLVVGEDSQASARLDATAFGGASALIVRSILGGSFLPGENLRIGNLQGSIFGRVGDNRERGVNVNVSHSGKLAGLRTAMRRREDGIYWVVMLNQDRTGSSFYLKNHDPMNIGIDNVIDSNITNWPSWDLFEQ